MSLVQSKKVSKWLLIIDFLYGSDLQTALNYSINGAEIFLAKGASVRAGSVIFLVGVGSLVCWKIWDYWTSGGDDPPFGKDYKGSPPPKTPHGKKSSKSPLKSPKAFFASFLEEEFVHDFDDFEDEDPALIQQLLDLARYYVKSHVMGKYFGPESPIENDLLRSKYVSNGLRPESKFAEDASPLTSEHSGKSRSDSGRHYLADNSASYSADDDEGPMTSDNEEDSLPFDGYLKVSSVVESTRVKKRHHRASRESYKNPPQNSSPSKSCENHCHSKSTNLVSKRFHPYGRNGVVPFNDEFSSSETSPRGPLPRHEETLKNTRQSNLPFLLRRQGDGSETPDSEEQKIHQHRRETSSKVTFYANCDSDEEWTSDSRLQPDGEEEIPRRRSLSRDISLSDLMGRLRRRGSRASTISRDNSVSSRLSDFLRRDDSICSNLSDFTFSECSELSMEFSLKDESIANQTISSLADIEDELNTLKSSVIEMDEEFIRYASRPNPYLLKTTFSDYSLDSSDSRPGSALDLINYRMSRSQSIGLADDTLADQSLETSISVSSDILDFSVSNLSHLSNEGEHNRNSQMLHRPIFDLGQSFEFDSPMAGWTPSKNIRIRQRSFSIEPIPRTPQDDPMLSLEWDNSGCLKQYDEDQDKNQTKGDYGLSENRLDRHKFLPDHSSLELDLEKELQSPANSQPIYCGREIFAFSKSPSPSPNIVYHSNQLPSEHHINSQNESHKTPSSHSTDLNFTMQSSQKKLPPSSLNLVKEAVPGNLMTTSVDSAIQSAPGSRSGSSSPLPQHLTESMMSSGFVASWSEVCEQSQNSKAGTGQKLPKNWDCDESGYVEEENGLDTSFSNLSPVHEIRENESLDHLSNYTGSERVCNENQENPHLEEASEDLDEINDNISHNNNFINNNMGNNTSLRYEPNETTNILDSPKSIGEKVGLVSYAHSEWQGNTNKSFTIRKGYNAIPSQLHVEHLRKIRGDNYCGIRATLYQIFASGIPIPEGYQVFNRLVSEINRGSSWLKNYSFGKRLSYSRDNVVTGFKECLEALDKFTLDLIGVENREYVVRSRLNNDSKLDIQLCEAVKLHMLVSAIDLYKDEIDGGHVPLFAMIMFSRQSSLNPKEFLANHLNAVGDSAGLEQIEMFLLGQALQVTLQVVRPSSFGSEDFICFYPDEHIGIWPKVDLVAEDDRHYNVLVK